MLNFRLAALLIVGLALASSVKAETRIFVVNASDGYGVDHCLAAGDRCGEAAAGALCRSQQFAQAVHFGRFDPAEITAASAESAHLASCSGPGCPDTVAITCSR
jgi:hypothetical protein